jgi:hypothetical protein
VTRAERLNERGRKLSERGDAEGAIGAYRAAIEADDSWGVPWYNLGLLHKYRGEWERSAECNREAVRRDSTDEAAWWNLGIAGTALGDWREAREAWLRCGVGVPGGEGPPAMNLGLVPIRLDPDGRAEVVWCDRIDPARAVIRNIPLPESGHFYGDLMLHDGAPEGSRMLSGREVPVFNALARLERSVYRTFVLDLPQSSREQRALLCDLARDAGSSAEDWSESVRFLCRRCSHGLPHGEHDTDLKASRPTLAMAIAARDPETVAELIERWREQTGYDGYAGFTVAGDDA